MPQTNNSSQNTQGKQGQEQEQEQALIGVHHKTKRPISLISQGKQIAYSYDVHGNIKTKTETPLNPQTGKPITQSDNGLIGYRKSVQFVYNPNNELKQTITITDTGLEVQRTTTNYFYDAFGRRIAKTSKVERLNKLNQRGELVKHPTALMHLRKTDKTTYQSTLMLWEGNRQIQEYTDDFVFTTVYDDQSFEPVARVVQSRDKTCDEFKVYHYHNNHLGTPQELTDEQGNIIWANYEFAWGGTYQSYYQEQSLNNIPIDKDHLQPLKFQGQFFDPETSLHYNRFRYYDSDVGMFIQRDPIGLLGGNNVFAYAPNPVGWVDPFGLAKFTVKVKNEIIDENTEFFGKPTCENCGIDLVKPKKSTKGVTPPANEWQTDHIEADVKGGANTKENGQLLCRKCNRDFWDKEKPNLKLQNREDYAKSQSSKKKNPCT